MECTPALDSSGHELASFAFVSQSLIYVEGRILDREITD
jgi:hypothetical protein